MRKNKIQFFNMIEVALAMAVIALGMTSILGLFPVGLNASRNAIAENYCADAVDQMISYFKGGGELSEGFYKKMFSDSGSLPDVSTMNSLRTSIDFSQLSLSFVDEYAKGDIWGGGSQFKRSANGWTIFEQDPLPGGYNVPYVYFIVQGTNAQSDDPNVSRKIDFSAMVLVWKSYTSTYLATGDYTDASNWQTWPASNSYHHFAALNIEISWPLEAPYSERTKRYYYIVVSKPI
jgi:hypothetical protein